MISISELLQNHAQFDELPLELKQNIKVLLERINDIRAAYGKPMQVTSGYRPVAYNAKIGGAPNSLHCKCAAVDIADKDGKFNAWCKTNIAELEKAQLWCEERQGPWQHLQIYPPKSGARFFKP